MAWQNKLHIQGGCKLSHIRVSRDNGPWQETLPTLQMWAIHTWIPELMWNNIVVIPCTVPLMDPSRSSVMEFLLCLRHKEKSMLFDHLHGARPLALKALQRLVWLPLIWKCCLWHNQMPPPLASLLNSAPAAGFSGVCFIWWTHSRFPDVNYCLESPFHHTIQGKENPYLLLISSLT